MIVQRVRSAIEALDRVSLPRQAARALTDLAHTATDRRY
jgi:hypothetical protein